MVTAGTFLVLDWRPSPPAEPTTPVTFALTHPVEEPVGTGPNTSNVAISQDGRYVVYTAGRAGWRGLYLRSLRELTPRLISDSAALPFFSPDGSLLIYAEEVLETGYDLMAAELDGTRRVRPLVRSRFNEVNGTISPDGRWLAYEADDSGRFEIYVRPYPDVDSSVALVSTAGGTKPIWTRGGEELIYVAPEGALMRVGVSAGSAWSATQPSTVVREGYFTNNNWWGRSYDVMPDGEKFLMLKEGGPAGAVSPAGFVVVQNWFEELDRLVPPN